MLRKLTSMSVGFRGFRIRATYIVNIICAQICVSRFIYQSFMADAAGKRGVPASKQAGAPLGWPCQVLQIS